MVLVCGLPNAGKTTYSERYPDCIHYDGIPLITPERYRCICESVKKMPDLCVDGVYGEKKRREELVKSCHSVGGHAVCIWLDTLAEECIRRENRDRPHGLVNLHAKTFEPPTLDEGWDEIITIKTERR